MTTLKNLKGQALAAARWRGHNLRRFFEVHGQDGTSWQVSYCKTCGAHVQVNDRPPPNGVDISGEAVALNCKGFLDPSLMSHQTAEQFGFGGYPSAWQRRKDALSTTVWEVSLTNFLTLAKRYRRVRHPLAKSKDAPILCALLDVYGEGLPSHCWTFYWLAKETFKSEARDGG